MVIAAPKSKTYSAEEYLDLDVESDRRSEFHDGAIVEMTGGTPEHNEITSVFNALLRVALKGQAYSIFITNQRLWIPQVNRYTYPDVMLTPRPPELKPGRKDTVMHPVLLAETLSHSTEAYDRGDKFAYYRTIKTFQEYVLIDQYRPHVDHYVRQTAHQWLFAEYDGLDASFTLASVSVEVALADLYEAIDFSQIAEDNA